ncbi:MAG TPA: SpoIID/LytB domain-containing protein, partial [Mycobacteriales bacterium]|nr:SpoIID/LytB domain-containing protein [Mycobacteriales bacterium]
MRTNTPLRRRAAVTAVALVTAAGLLPAAVLTAGPAAAETVHPRAAAWTVAGHGWGHGRGMSQHGALGAAQNGKGYGEIVSFYYPGTTLTPVDTSQDWIRVLLTADWKKELSSPPLSPSLQVDYAAGLTAHAGGRSMPLGLADLWQVVRVGSRSSDRLVLQSFANGQWTSHRMPGDTDIYNAGPIAFTSTSGVLRRIYPTGQTRDYRNELRAVDAGSGLAVVNHLLMEPYLKAVVPAEMPASWHLEALRAQSVAARSYSSRVRADARKANPSGAWDICDSTQCQVYGGVGSEDPRTNGAVDATAGRTLMYGGYPVFAEFSSSNGGWTVAGKHPYQVAKHDPYDGLAGGSVHRWSAKLTPADLEKRFPQLGTLTRLRVVTRDGNGDWGGRVLTVVLEGVKDGAATSVTTTGREVYLSRPWPSVGDGLRSNWWTITGSTSDPVGSLDLVRSGPTGERIAGWALDRDADVNLRVHVYVDGRGTIA